MPLTGKIEQIPLLDIVVRPDANPRSGFDEGKLFDLQRSMDEVTQLQPIIVSRTAGKLYLVAGERRLRAAVAAGAPTIEAKVFDDLGLLDARRMALAENKEREPLNIIEEARSYKQALDEGITEDELVRSQGLAVETLRKRLTLLELPEEVRRLMVRENNPLPIHQALCLRGLDVGTQIELARRAAPPTKRVASEEEVRAWVTEAKDKKQGKLDMAGKPVKKKKKKGKSAGPDLLDSPEEKTTRLPVTSPPPTEKSAAEKIKTLAVILTAVGSMRLTGSRCLEVPSAKLAFEIDGKAITFNCDIILDCEHTDPAAMEAICMAMVAAPGKGKI